MPDPELDANDLTPDPIMAKVAAKLAEYHEEHLGAVPLSGFLAPIGAAGETGVRRLYIDEQLRSWLEIDPDDIYGQIVSDNALDRRSTLYVKRTAAVRMCRNDVAAAFFESDLHSLTDPTGADFSTRGSWPRPKP